MAGSVLGPATDPVQIFALPVLLRPPACYRRAVQRPPAEPIRPTTIVIAAVIFYGLMSIAGVVMLALTDHDPVVAIFGPGLAEIAEGHPAPPFSHPIAALIGIGAGLVVVAISAALRRIGPVERLQKEFGTLLGDQSTGTVAVLAVTSSVGEELFFRGALMPLIGFWPTAILFGVLHGGGAPRLFAWTIFAFLSGILLGALAVETGSLLAPILCHLTINFWNLQAIGAAASREANP